MFKARRGEATLLRELLLSGGNWPSSIGVGSRAAQKNKVLFREEDTDLV